MSPLRNGIGTAAAAFVATLTWIATSLRTVSRVCRRVLARSLHLTRNKLAAGRKQATSVATGPGKRFVTGPVRVFAVGQRTDVSILALLLAPVLAAASAWWVGSTVGYGTLTAWVRGTWAGTDPAVAVFLAVGALVALAAVSAAINSGLLPTYVLVSAPVFGAAVTRYGTTVTYSWGTEVVSLPDAVGVALLLALGFGLPLAVSGFVLGRLLRRVVTVLGGRSGPHSPVDHS